MNRRSILIGALTLPVLPSVGGASVDPDAELLSLIAEQRKARAAVEAAWDIARPLTAAALAEAKRRGLHLDRDWDAFSALHDEIGAGAAEEIADAAAEYEIGILTKIRETRPRTLEGLVAKFGVLRKELQITDDIPRGDQDIGHEFFNVFGDDLKAMLP